MQELRPLAERLDYLINKVDNLEVYMHRYKDKMHDYRKAYTDLNRSYRNLVIILGVETVLLIIFVVFWVYAYV